MRTQLDLRVPIGALLTLYGGILAIHGLIVGATVLGLNINLYWGALMAVCGGATLLLARRRR